MSPSRRRSRFDAFSDECNLARAGRLNTMVIGPSAMTRRVLVALTLQSNTPVLEVAHGKSLELSTSRSVGTLVVHDVGDLDPGDQRRMCEWLDQASLAPRIISFAPQPLLQAVAKKAFLDALYYRLNTVYIDLTKGGLSA